MLWIFDAFDAHHYLFLLSYYEHVRCLVLVRFGSDAVISVYPNKLMQHEQIEASRGSNVWKSVEIYFGYRA